MRAKRTKSTIPAASPVVEISGQDRELLTNAYKTALIAGWKYDGERGYRVTLGNRRDEYVEIAKLSTYLERLRKTTV
jgi:hypothetical protein